MAAFLPFQRAGVSGFLHPPSGTGDQGLVLTHGAGGNCRAFCVLLLATQHFFVSATLRLFFRR